MSKRALCVVCFAPGRAGLGPLVGASLNSGLPGGRPVAPLVGTTGVQCPRCVVWCGVVWCGVTLKEATSDVESKYHHRLREV